MSKKEKRSTIPVQKITPEELVSLLGDPSEQETVVRLEEKESVPTLSEALQILSFLDQAGALCGRCGYGLAVYSNQSGYFCRDCAAGIKNCAFNTNKTTKVEEYLCKALRGWAEFTGIASQAGTPSQE